MKGDHDTLATKTGNVLRAARERAGLSQSQVEERAGLAPSTLSQAECGYKLPVLGTLIKIARGLGVSASSLVADLEKEMGSGRKSPAGTGSPPGRRR